MDPKVVLNYYLHYYFDKIKSDKADKADKWKGELRLKLNRDIREYNKEFQKVNSKNSSDKTLKELGDSLSKLYKDYHNIILKKIPDAVDPVELYNKKTESDRKDDTELAKLSEPIDNILDKVLDAGKRKKSEPIKPGEVGETNICLLYTSPSPRDLSTSRMPSSA